MTDRDVERILDAIGDVHVDLIRDLAGGTLAWYGFWDETTADWRRTGPAQGRQPIRIALPPGVDLAQVLALLVAPPAGVQLKAWPRPAGEASTK